LAQVLADAKKEKERLSKTEKTKTKDKYAMPKNQDQPSKDSPSGKYSLQKEQEKSNFIKRRKALNDKEISDLFDSEDESEAV